jgi:hypothetical protein
LKAIHYCILLYHFSGLHKQTSNYPHWKHDETD